MDYRGKRGIRQNCLEMQVKLQLEFWPSREEPSTLREMTAQPLKWQISGRVFLQGETDVGSEDRGRVHQMEVAHTCKGRLGGRAVALGDPKGPPYRVGWHAVEKEAGKLGDLNLIG